MVVSDDLAWPLTPQTTPISTFFFAYCMLVLGNHSDFKFCNCLAVWSISHEMTNSPSSERGRGHVTLKFWEISNNISEMVRCSDIVTYNRKLIGNRMRPIEWHKYRWPSGSLKVTCHILCNTNNSENLANFNFDVFIHKSKSAHNLRFNFYWRKWRTFQGHWQSRTMQKQCLE